MKVVGVTGGIGSGKSTVCKVFSSLGVPVFHSDEVSKSILFSPEVAQLVIKKFGDKVAEGGELSRGKLAEVVFKDKQGLAWLNSVLHPKVAEEFVRWQTNQKFPFCLKEAAILFESGGASSCDFTVNIQCSEEVRMKRVIKRDKRTRQQVLDIIAKQLSESERTKLADYNINNEDQKVIPQVLHLYKIFSR